MNKEKENDKKINEILELVKSIQKSSAVKDDLKELRKTVSFIKNNAVTHDDIVGLEQRLNDMGQEISYIKIQLSSIEHELEDIKDSLKKLEAKTQEDTDATVTKMVNLEKKVAKIEQKVENLQTAYNL